MRSNRFIVVVMVYIMICTGALWIGTDMDVKAAEKNQTCIDHVDDLIESYREAFKQMREVSKPLKKWVGSVTKSAKSYSSNSTTVKKLMENGVSKKNAVMLSKMFDKRLEITRDIEDMVFKAERIKHLTSNRQIKRTQIPQKCNW